MTWDAINKRYKIKTDQLTGWTEGAMFCFESNRDCANCLNSKLTSGHLRWGSRPTCWMPVAIQAMLDSGLPFGKKVKRVAAAGDDIETVIVEMVG